MKYFLIAGEASGDLHGANLIGALKKADREAGFRCFGGDRMKAEGADLVGHYRDVAYMGVLDVVANIRTIRRHFRRTVQEVLSWQPDCMVLIDFAGFNLRMARVASAHGIPVLYYISPKLWAWNKSRIRKIRAYVDRMFVILPFEVDFYRENGYGAAEYLGHPLMDEIAAFEARELPQEEFPASDGQGDAPYIALLAGSRKQELKYCLPEMLKAASAFPGYRFVIAGAPGLEEGDYEPYLEGHDVALVFGRTYELVSRAAAAVVTSGTATLEAALLGTPQVVVYRMKPLTYHVGKHFVNVRFFSLVNLIMEREVVRELLQFEVGKQIVAELKRILDDKGYRERMLADLKELREKMGGPGASERVAEGICKVLKK